MYRPIANASISHRAKEIASSRLITSVEMDGGKTSPPFRKRSSNCPSLVEIKKVHEEDLLLIFVGFARLKFPGRQVRERLSILSSVAIYLVE